MATAKTAVKPVTKPAPKNAASPAPEKDARLTPQQQATQQVTHQIHAIRHANFMRLFQDFKTKHADEPDKGMVKKFAERINMTEAYASHLKNRYKKIGNQSARQIETALKLSPGYMDLLHGTPHAPIDPSEALFIDMCVALYRGNPLMAKEWVTRAMTEQMMRTNQLARQLDAAQQAADPAPAPVKKAKPAAKKAAAKTTKRSPRA